MLTNVAEMLSNLPSSGDGGGGGLTSPVAIADGGTGQTTAANARTALDVYSKAQVDSAVAGAGDGTPWRLLLDPGFATMTGTWTWTSNASSQSGGYWYLGDNTSGGALSWPDAIPGPGTYKLSCIHYQAYDSGVGSVFVDNVDTTANLDFAGNNSAAYNVLIHSATFTVSGSGTHDLAVKILDPSDDNSFWRCRPVIFELVRTA